MSSDEQDSETSRCCCAIMSWLRKVKELVQDSKDSDRSHSRMGEENEMTTVFPTSNGPELAVNGSKNPKERSSSLSSANSYTIDKPAEQANGGGELREKETNGRISPTSESNESTTSTSQTCAKKLQSKSLADLPVAMTNATGIFHNNQLLVGGGFTGRSKDDVLLYSYDSNFDFWTSLPPAPLKWSTLTSLDNQVMLVGGKEAGKPGIGYTNRVAVFDEESKAWVFFNPPMQVARLSPVVLTYNGYLIVAGGSKGSLDYNVEIYDPATRQWTTTIPLPHKCFRHTSTTINGVWYLLNSDSGLIYYVDILFFIQHHCGYDQQKLVDDVEDSLPDALPSSSTNEQIHRKISKEQNEVWKLIEEQPHSKPFCITSLEGYLLALSHAKGAVVAYAYMDGSWERVGKLPFTAATGSMTVDLLGKLYLFGGEGACGKYSSKSFKVSLVPKDTKKPTVHVALDTSSFLTDQ